MLRKTDELVILPIKITITNIHRQRCKKEPVTVLKDALDVQPIGGARLVVRTPLEVVREFSRARVVYHARVTLTDRIYNCNVSRALTRYCVRKFLRTQVTLND